MRFVTGLFLIVLTLVSATALADGKPYRPPRLPDGQPDLQGMWDHVNATPLVRPVGYSTLVVYPEQAAAIEAMVDSVLLDPKVPYDPNTGVARAHVLPIRGTLRSSIIIDPEDGALPCNALFQEKFAAMRAGVVNAMDGPEQRPTAERCLGSPVAQPPILYNPGAGENLHQIVQTKDAVIFYSEVLHDARIIRLHSVHVPAAIKSWLGDSIGWWEGETLVVETKFFTPSDSARIAGPFIGFLISPQATVVERFTRVSEGELNYVFTVDDPMYYTRPWTGETHFLRSTEQMFEYSCHEGNYSLTYILQAARARERLPLSEK
jgi:hypothetical protein